MKNSFKKILLSFTLVVMATINAFADGLKPPASLYNPFVVLFAIVIILLAVIIAVLAKLVITSATMKLQRDKDEEKRNTTLGSGTFFTLLLVGLSINLFAQDKEVTTVTTAFTYGLDGVSETAYYLLGGVVILELLLVGVLLFMLQSFLPAQKKTLTIVAVAVKPQYNWRVYGSLSAVLVVTIFIWRYYAAQPLPPNKEEIGKSVATTDSDKLVDSAKSASNFDETNVKLLTDSQSLDGAKNLFLATCSACHTPTGGGSVGPNLTDDYWLHGGSINDIFKTIKYGVADKGMKSWKDDFTPLQIQQLASYIKSLHDTHPPNPKAPQGSLYLGEAMSNSQR